MNVQFGVLNESNNNIEAVTIEDGQAAPVSNLLNVMFRNKNVRINRLGLNNGIIINY